MATALYRLGKTAYRRWYVFIAAWIVLLGGAGAAAAAYAEQMVDNLTIPGIPSLQARDLRTELFPGTEGEGFDNPSVTVVVQTPQDATLAEPEYAQAVEQLIAELRQLPQMPTPEQSPQLVNPVPAAQAQHERILGAAAQSGVPPQVAEANARTLSPLSEDKRTGTMTFSFDADTVAEVEQSTIEQTMQVLEDAAEESGMRVEANGSGFQQMPEVGGTSELLGIAVAAVALLVTFGSLVAAGLPIINALVGVGLGMLGIRLATVFTDIGTTTPVLATMIGLAVGIDYTLFILSRYRTELRHTDDRAEAVGRAVGTAGSAVVFAGLTVLIALSMLFVVNIPFLTTMGLAAGATVLTAVLVALTLLPAVLGMLKRFAFGGQIRKRTQAHDAQGRIANNGVRWAQLIRGRPALVVLLVVLVLGTLALPARNLQLALPSDATAPTSTTQRKAADLIAQGFGAGRQAPLMLVVDGRQLTAEDPRLAGQQRMEAFGKVVQWAAEQDNVANAQIVGVNEEGVGASVLVTPKTGQGDPATTDLLDALRAGTGDIEEQTGATVGITGLTAIEVDVSERLSDALPTYLAVVVGLAFLLLMVVFRSLLVPLTATLGFLLSVLATFGTTVAVFQEGTFGLVDGQPLVSFMPMILIGIVFGLAMDYQVFLVSRMHEMYAHGDTAHEAILDGFRHGARVVTAAAIIMIAVFGAFILQDDQLIQSMGFALAIAILFDAFIVRMTLIPAAMYLLGDRAWWLPRWMDRIMPKIDIEGVGLRPEEDWAEEVSHRGDEAPEDAPSLR